MDCGTESTSCTDPVRPLAGCPAVRDRALMIAPLVLYAAAQLPPAPHWRWPVDVPFVTRPFDPPSSPYAAGHRGVDLAAPPGTAVRAPASGVIAYAGPLAGRGVVVIRHDGLRSTYEPLRVAVHVGERVVAGALLGWLQPGHAGCPQPACLHWGVLRGSTYLDPLSFVLGQVRLLPHLPESGGAVNAAHPTTHALLAHRRPSGISRAGKHHRALGALAGAAAGGGFAVLRRRKLLGT